MCWARFDYKTPVLSIVLEMAQRGDWLDTADKLRRMTPVGLRFFDLSRIGHLPAFRRRTSSPFLKEGKTLDKYDIVLPMAIQDKLIKHKFSSTTKSRLKLILER
jgi:hypothetical protein